MDKNSVIGFGLLMVLLIGYIFYNQRAEAGYLEQKRSDSLAQARLNPPKATPLAAATASSSSPDSSNTTPAAVPESLITLENNDVAIELSNYGAYPKKIRLKKFKTHSGQPLLLFDGNNNSIDYAFKSKDGRMVHTQSIPFQAQKSADGLSVNFTSPDFSITYRIDSNGYMMQTQTQSPNADLSSPMKLLWTSRSLLTEQDIESQRQYTQVCYNLEKEGYDFFTISEKKDQDFTQAIKWLSFKQHYFNTTLITDNKIMASAKVSAAPVADTATKALSDFKADITLVPATTIALQYFVGPNDYKLLKSYNKELEEIIPLSYGIFGFVKYINTWIILPIFNFLSDIFSSYGIVILLLTLIIRLLISPFTYKSYVSSAKMKALKPELDELKAKYGDDKQAMGVEQMKMYRQAGVNPLGGCLPALLQLPVFFALLSFFPHAIELRQSSFLWAHDLSTYDSILNLPFTIPFYGDHVSLFTLLFVITSILMALYSMNMTMDQDNPMMKYMPFIMPVMFLGIFNKLPAALTYYYFVSNVITLLLQFIIQKFIINPDKIHADIQAKKAEGPKESKLMQKMAEMQKQQQERMKNRK
jgi:YidC/Oxa1 family membrane protein insertase